MKIIGAIQAEVPSDFFHSLGEHTEVQHHAPADFDYDDAIGRIQNAEAGLAPQPLLPTRTTFSRTTLTMLPPLPPTPQPLLPTISILTTTRTTLAK